MTELFAVLLLAATPVAGAPLALNVEGDLVKNRALSVKDLAQLGTVTVDWLDTHAAHAKNPEAAACGAPAQKSDVGCGHKVTGVRLDRVLLRLGFSEGPMGPQADPKQKHHGLRGAVIASAADGFEAVFSIGELLETLGATHALVVWELDGKPLPAGMGPFRILVLTDKSASRSIYQVTGLRVVDLKAK